MAEEEAAAVAAEEEMAEKKRKRRKKRPWKKKLLLLLIWCVTCAEFKLLIYPCFHSNKFICSFIFLSSAEEMAEIIKYCHAIIDKCIINVFSTPEYWLCVKLC